MPSRSPLRRLPNLLSASRLFLAFGFVLSDGTAARVGYLSAAAATDFLDGWLARRVNAASQWGALIDPIADRFFVLIAVGALLLEGTLSTSAYFVLISRDLATALGFLVARAVPWLRPVVFKARPVGKLVTALQFLALLSALLAPRFFLPLVVLVGAASVGAIVDYTLALWRARMRGPRTPGAPENSR